MRLCSLPNCDLPHEAKGFCKRHYLRQWRHGDLDLRAAPNSGRKAHPLYSTYCNMLDRCRRSTNTYFADYGGRGIRVCERWLGVAGFDNFVKDMGLKLQGTSLDRIDNDGNYDPSNCRWADKYDQAANRRAPRSGQVGVAGVTYIAKVGKYRARIRRRAVDRSLGLYDTLDEAARAVRAYTAA